MHLKILSFVLYTVFVLPPAFAQATSHYEVTLLIGVTGTTQSTALGVSTSGVVGSSMMWNNDGSYFVYPTLWQGAQGVSLPVPDGYIGVATAITNSGDVMGIIRRIDAYDPQPVLWHNGQLQLLDTLGMPAGQPYSINNSGVVVGQTYEVPDKSQAVLWDHGQVAALGNFGLALAINNSNQVLVAGDTVQPADGIWSNGSVIQIPSLGGKYLASRDINNNGHVVGTADLPNGTSSVFLFKDGVTTPLPDLPNDLGNSFARSLNDADQVVGSGYNGVQGSHAVLWQDGSPFDLNSLIPSNSGWTLYEAMDITNDGSIVGDGNFNGQTMAFLLTPTNVPEPTTISLVTVATFSLLCRRR